MDDAVPVRPPISDRQPTTPASVIWPVPVPIWSGRDRLTLMLLTAIMIGPALLMAVAVSGELTGWGSRVLLYLPLVIVVGLVVASPCIRDPEPDRVGVLPWQVWAGGALTFVAVTAAVYGSLSLSKNPSAVELAAPRGEAVWLVDPDLKIVTAGVAVAASVTLLTVGIGYVVRKWGRRWLVIASGLSVLVIFGSLTVLFFQNLGDSLTSNAETSPGAGIAFALAIVCWLPAPTLGLIARAERRVGRMWSSLQ